MNVKLKHNYKAWNINKEAFPQRGTIEEKIKFISGYGILAPSTHNTQPWLFQVRSNRLIITPDSTKMLIEADPLKWGLYISLGACVENIMQAASAFGLKVTYSVGQEIILLFSEQSNRGNKEILSYIKKRTSNKLTYSDKQIGKEIIEDIQNNSSGSIQVKVIADRRVMKKIVSNHIIAAKVLASNIKFVKELSNWLRSNITRSENGMPGFVVGNNILKSIIGPHILKNKPGLLLKLVKEDERLLKSSACYLVFCVKSRNPNKTLLINSGRIIQETWLSLTKHKLSAHPMFAAIQHDEARERLAKLVFTPNMTPVFFMRVGHGSNYNMRHTPRKLIIWS